MCAGPTIGKGLAPIGTRLGTEELIELIDHLKGTGAPGSRFPSQWYGTLSHLRRREIRELVAPGRRMV